MSEYDLNLEYSKNLIELNKNNFEFVPLKALLTLQRWGIRTEYEMIDNELLENNINREELITAINNATIKIEHRIDILNGAYNELHRIRSE